MSNWRVTEVQLPVTEVQLPQIGRSKGHNVLLAQSVQCTGMYALIDTCRVTEVTDFPNDRDLVMSCLQIYRAPIVFMIIYIFLSIARKVSYFSYRTVFFTFGGAK
jgi:hypothetical protein